MSCDNSMTVFMLYLRKWENKYLCTYSNNTFQKNLVHTIEIKYRFFLSTLCQKCLEKEIRNKQKDTIEIIIRGLVKLHHNQKLFYTKDERKKKLTETNCWVVTNLKRFIFPVTPQVYTYELEFERKSLGMMQLMQIGNWGTNITQSSQFSTLDATILVCDLIVKTMAQSLLI